jgi:hypothetical protein
MFHGGTLSRLPVTVRARWIALVSAAVLGISVLGLATPAHAATDGTISGVITDAGSPSLSGDVCGVVLAESGTPFDGDEFKFIDCVDTSGDTYSVDVPPGTYAVAMFGGSETDEYVSQFYGGDVYAPGTLVTVGDGQAVTGINFAMVTGGHITGHISAAGGGTLAGQVCVTAQDRAVSGDEGLYDDLVPTQCVTTNGGAYDVSGFPTGDYSVKFSGAPYVDQYYSGKTEVTANAVHVVAGQTTSGIDALMTKPATPPTPPTSNGLYRTVFQANTTALWLAQTGGANLGLGLMPGTSPSIATLPGGGYQIAFQANTGALWSTGTLGTRNWQLGMKAGTSPSIAALANGGYQIAFQANTGALWTAGTAGIANLQLGMRPGTSPAIAGVGTGYQIAFQANTGALWTTGTSGTRDWKLGMLAGTSPAIAAIPGGSYQIAFQSNTGLLWIASTQGVANLGLGMKTGTSPAITPLLGSHQIAFQSNTGILWTTGALGVHNSGLGMLAGTNPSIVAVPGGYEAAFQSNTGSLWTGGTAGVVNWGLGMSAGTSPAIAR